MDRLRHLTPILALVFLVSSACDDGPPSASSAPPSRFAAVRKNDEVRPESTFCERSFPESGPGALAWSPPPERPIPGVPRANDAGGWAWVNLWASWCGPCLEEIPLLVQWKKGFEKDGLAVRFEMWSIDEVEGELLSALAKHKAMPGPVRWLRSQEDLPGLMSGLGVDKGSAIPIHALVDPAGKLRCVRVGSVGENAFGTVRAILSGR